RHGLSPVLGDGRAGSLPPARAGGWLRLLPPLSCPLARGQSAERRTVWSPPRPFRASAGRAPSGAPAFRRSTAAILGSGTVASGDGRRVFTHPDPGGFRLRSSGPRPAH